MSIGLVIILVPLHRQSGPKGSGIEDYQSNIGENGVPIDTASNRKPLKIMKIVPFFFHSKMFKITLKFSQFIINISSE